MSPVPKRELESGLDDLALTIGPRASIGTGDKRRVSKLLVVVLVLAGVGGTAAAAVLLSQTFPPVQAFGMTGNCDTLTPSNQSVVLGSSGHIVFDCLGSSRAFHTDGVFMATPTFGLPTSYSALYIFPYVNTDADLCVNIDGVRGLTSGVSMSFTGETPDWAYCAEYVNVTTAGLASFTVTWST